MKTCIIACRTLETELLSAMANTGCAYPVIWLEAGGHNLPDRRRREIQTALDSCTGFDTVLLAMSLCGNLVAGLESRDFRLVVPKCEDCITLLLGSRQQRLTHPGTYFLTEGWLMGRDNIVVEYQRSVEKYGAVRAQTIFSGMFANYTHIAFVDTGRGDAKEQVQSIAKALNLAYTQIPGTLDWLEELLRPNWDDRRFLTLPPHSTLTLDACLQTT